MTKLAMCPQCERGRRGDVIDRLADAIRATEGVRLLDRTSDFRQQPFGLHLLPANPDAGLRATHALIDVGTASST